jgi:hypothetical protein
MRSKQLTLNAQHAAGLATVRHRQGRLSEAETLYRKVSPKTFYPNPHSWGSKPCTLNPILQIPTHQPEALHLLPLGLTHNPKPWTLIPNPKP